MGIGLELFGTLNKNDNETEEIDENTVKKLNLVNSKSQVKPNYDLSKREKYIKIQLTLDKQLIIIGVIDNNYIYWLSITKLEDKKTNRAIFNYVAKGEYESISSIDRALKQKNLDYGIMKRSYGARFTNAENVGSVWKTPFGHYYSKDNIQDHGKFFARSVCYFYEEMLKKCKIRRANGLYKSLLIQLTIDIEKIDCMAYDSEVKPIQEMLSYEGYLILSSNKDVRDLYSKCLELCNDKYNAYMTNVR